MDEFTKEDKIRNNRLRSLWHVLRGEVIETLREVCRMYVDRRRIYIYFIFKKMCLQSIQQYDIISKSDDQFD